MTLTTEQLRERAKFWREKAVEAKWESVSIAQDMLQNADAFDELADNREAQPVGYIDPDSLKEYRGQRAGGTWSAVQRTTSGLNMTTPIYTAPPAPAVPDKPRLPPHIYRDLLDMQQEVAIAYGGTQQLRAQLSSALSIHVQPDHPHTRAAMLAAAPEG